MTKNNVRIVKQIEVPCYADLREHGCGLFVPNHWHDYFEFEMVIDGEYEHIYNGKKYTAHAGDAWIMTNFDYHSIRALKGSKIVTVGFSNHFLPDDMSNAISSYGSKFLCRFDKETTKLLYALSIKIIEELKMHSPYYHHMISSTLTEIIIETIREVQKSSPTPTTSMPKLVQTVTSYLYRNYKDDLSLDNVAEKFHVSSGHLGVLFKKTFSMSYNSYVNRIRMKYACDLLVSTDLTTKEIAADCGYNSVEYFYYIFNKHFSCTPAEYRKEGRK